MKKSKKKTSPKKAKKPVAKKKAKATKKTEPTVRDLARSAAMAGATVTISYEKNGETMDRSALKVIASQLKEMGSDIKVLKSDTDEMLQKKINEQLRAVPKPEILKKLDDVVPEKLVSVLKNDCIGIFIDLSDISCVRCKDAGKCASLFLQNVKGGFEHITKALPDKKEDEKPVVEKAKVKPVSRYEPDRLVFVRDVKNPNPKGDPYHDTLQAVLDEEPSTLGELREIVERDFDLDSDSDFMKFVTSMRDPAEGIIKLDVDLSEKNKKELRAAGIDI